MRLKIFCGNPLRKLLPHIELNEFHISFHNLRPIACELRSRRIPCLFGPRTKFQGYAKKSGKSQVLVCRFDPEDWSPELVSMLGPMAGSKDRVSWLGPMAKSQCFGPKVGPR